ncbi:hypothetical protein EW093_01865 [Thiospirochaeta perfilievii]|uniref:Uncharacterized protein n=1 Tax=Thiospirochaeta perfilievii TaxID=252967 RepID=A0A5C1Q8X1_9SPIO|nr:hypothetical protein [Thiospirochaeta perfilievii]QEN03500.1 hypothetical protein EW093_01865 [Thiospirochaeta perfilievii]
MNEKKTINIGPVLLIVVLFIIILVSFIGRIRANNRLDFILNNNFDFVHVFIDTAGNVEKKIKIEQYSKDYNIITSSMNSVIFEPKKQKKVYDKIFFSFIKNDKSTHILIYYREDDLFLSGVVSYSGEFDLYPKGKSMYINDPDNKLRDLVDRLIHNKQLEQNQ